MAKILLVEDDKALREIYGVRLLAEGYDIVSAGDGEEALTVAIREKPVLIISDVMMPKISGFEMLDLLRSNEATRDIKVIMMTALSGDQHRERGESLGADRYLVKSQVGIEDVVNTVHEILSDQGEVVQPAGAATPTPATPPMPAPNQSPINPPAATLPSAVAGVPAPVLPPTPPSIPVVTTPTVPAPTPVAGAPGITPISDTPTAPVAPASTPDLPPIAPPGDTPPASLAEVPAPTADTVLSFQPQNTTDEDVGPSVPQQPSVDLAQSSGAHVATRIIQPTGEAVTPKIDMANLIANEEAKDIMSQPTAPAVQPPAPDVPSADTPAIPEIQVDTTGAISINSLPTTPSQDATFPNQAS